MNLLLLTCSTKEEALKIAKELLEKRLVACTKITSVESNYLWKGNLENSNEVLLVMESHESKFNEIEKVVKSLHSYEQFVLVGFPITQMASGVSNWLNKELALNL